jgi:hypothetical protein
LAFLPYGGLRKVEKFETVQDRSFWSKLMRIIYRDTKINIRQMDERADKNYDRHQT